MNTSNLRSQFLKHAQFSIPFNNAISYVIIQTIFSCLKVPFELCSPERKDPLFCISCRLDYSPNYRKVKFNENLGITILEGRPQAGQLFLNVMHMSATAQIVD